MVLPSLREDVYRVTGRLVGCWERSSVRLVFGRGVPPAVLFLFVVSACQCMFDKSCFKADVRSQSVLECGESATAPPAGGGNDKCPAVVVKFDAQPVRLVLVEWLDSYGCSSVWQDLTDDAPKAMICRSVGWLLHDTDDCKVIVPHLSEASHPQAERQQGCGDMTIPTRAVMRIVDLSPVP